MAVALWSQAVLVVSGVVVARALGPENRGVLALAILVPVVVDTVIALGVPFAVTYTIANNRLSGRSILRRARPLLVAQSLAVCGLAGFLLARVLSGTALGHSPTLIGLVCLAPAGLLQMYALATLQGERRFVPFNLLRVAPGTGYVAGVLAVSATGEHSLTSFAWAWIVPTTLGPIVTAWVAFRSSTTADASSEAPRIRRLLSFGTRGLLGASSPVEQYRLDQLVVALALSVTDLGIYVVAAAFTNLTRFLGQSIGMVAYPTVAAERDAQRQLDVARRYVTVGLVASIALTIPLIVLMPSLLPMLFGPDFSPAIRAAQILLLASLAATARRLTGDVCRGAGFPTWGTVSELTTLVSLPLVFIGLSLGDGINGVAGGLLVANLLGLLVIAPFLAGFRPSRNSLPPIERSSVSTAMLTLLMPIVGGVVLSRESLSLNGTLVMLIFLTLVLGTVVRIGRSRRFDIFDPFFVFVLTWTVLFVLRPIRMLFTGNLNYEFLDVSRGLPTALAMAMVGAFGFIVGYELRAGSVIARRLPVISVAPTARPIIQYSGGLALLGIVLYGLFIVQSGGLSALGSFFTGRSLGQRELYQASSAYLYFGLYLCVPAGLLVYWLALNSSVRRHYVLAVLLLVPVLARVAAGGTRSWLLPILTSLVVLYYAHNDRRPRLVSVLTAMVVVLGCGIVFLGQFRDTEGRSSVSSGALIHDSVRPDQSAVAVLDSADTEMLPLLALTAQAVPRTVPYTWGRSSTQALFQWVPRKLWPHKPRPADEMVAAKLLSDPYFGGSSRQFTPLLAFYLDFGFVGVGVGMLLLGIAIRMLYAYFLLHQRIASVQIIFAAISPFVIVLLRGSVTDTLTRLLFVVPPLLGGLLVASRSSSTACFLQTSRAQSLSTLDPRPTD